ncbi:MAG: hypothetical protein HYY26_04420 [Acidobacteria bacterium]|nr:hypothetical protein [Acidobacteriota bacterium]
MRLTFWGTRGSVPAPARTAWRYGGNTACIEVRAGSQLLILDAGTGIRELGRQLAREFGAAGFHADLLLSHYHWDHIQGLPFFEPLYAAGNTVAIFGPPPAPGVPSTLAGVLNILFHTPFFPVALEQLKTGATLRELDWKSDFSLGEFRLRTCRLRHPQGALAYRLEHEDASVVYATDHEPGHPSYDKELIRLARQADLLIADAHFLPEELRNGKKSWGHGSWESAVELAHAAGVRNLVLFHHESFRSDEEIEEIVERARRRFEATWAASDGLVVAVEPGQVEVGSLAARLGQRAALHLPIEVVTQENGKMQREEAQLENLSFYGAYILSPRRLEPKQPIEVSMSLQAPRPNGQGSALAPPAENRFHLRGYVLRSEPVTVDSGWNGIAVHFPGLRPTYQSGRPLPAPTRAPEPPRVSWWQKLAGLWPVARLRSQ